MFVSTAAVGSIVGLQSAEIQQMASEYEEKVCTRQRMEYIVGTLVWVIITLMVFSNVSTLVSFLSFCDVRLSPHCMPGRK